MFSEAVPILALVTLQRLGELWLSARNERRLRGAGAIEVGRSHYPWMVAMHAAWLAGLWLLAWNKPANWWLVAAYAVVQLLRYWVIASLGGRWTTRVLVLPGAPLVTSGPYRFLRHPNYLVVALEIALLPLAFGLVAFAVAFSLANAVVLAWRIHVEERAWQAAP
ncbi:MAG TPA: isoprenylcysteine carboxylmethyltransferase family protein [Xanthobacteraceae bacterium]|jgi:methyltransferase